MHKLRWIWILVSVIGCASLPSKPRVSTLDCLARSDCFVVRVDNSFNRYSVELRLNNTYYGQIESHDSKEFSIYDTQLVHGNCATATARMIENGYRMQSDESCIRPGEYYSIQILNVPWKMWLTAFRLKQ